MGDEDLSELTQEELDLAKGRAELAIRDIEHERERREAAARRSREGRAAVIASYLMSYSELVDAMAPEHTAPRYEHSGVCSDSSRTGHERRESEPKEYGCRRCMLLSIAAGNEAPLVVLEALGCE